MLPFAAVLETLAEDPWPTLIRAGAMLFIGLPVVWFIGRLIGLSLIKRHSEHMGMLARKLFHGLGYTIIVLLVMAELGFDLTALLATAGIATIAIGFAAQTSLSNVISGVFVLGERPFAVGDLVRIDGTLGIVLSIDLLSVKLRTLDNLFVRIPNEQLLKTQVTNVTRFPIRRLDVEVGVAYKEDAARVMRILREIADANPYSLDEPEPLILFKNFGSSSLDFLLGMWFEKTNYLNLKNAIMVQIKERFDAEGIEIAFPHLSLYAGEASEPFPVRVVEPTAKEAGHRPDSV